MPFAAQSHSGILHHFTSRLVAFEHADTSALQAVAQSTSSGTTGAKPPPKNYILFLGGLGDGLCTVAYPSVIAHALTSSATSAATSATAAAQNTHASPATWAVVEVLLGSSYSGWTTSHLVRDADQVGQAVSYFRSLQAAALEDGPSTFQSSPKIVLSGHSTGCQIAMEYLVGPNANASASANATHASLSSSSLKARPPVDGVVLQAGISDREGIQTTLTADECAKSVAAATSWIAAGKGDDVLGRTEMPGQSASIFGARPTASRWVSLVGPDGPGTGLDDYFSSDISAAALERTFGRVSVPLCVFLSGSDQYMPASVDKMALLEKWKAAVRQGAGEDVWSAESAIVPGASHNLNGDAPEVASDLAARVIRFVTGLPATVGREQHALL